MTLRDNTENANDEAQTAGTPGDAIPTACASSQTTSGQPRLLANKIVVVTGSSTGIGRQTALESAACGADVVIHARADCDAIESLKNQIEQLGARCQPVFADFAVVDGFDPFVEKVWAWRGHVDAWVNNAGADVLTGPWAQRSQADKLQHLLKVDVSASLLLSKAIGKRMATVWQSQPAADRKPGSFSIVNIGWDQAWQGMAGESGELFATTKGAIMSMTKSLAQTFAPAVRVNCVAPGWIRTAWGEQTSDEWNQRAISESLMQRWGQPVDVAHAITWLISDKASFVSGQILPINGGFRTSPDAPPPAGRGLG